MDTTWKKNTHILIESASGYLKVDSQGNIRRTSYLGRLWFKFIDWCTSGGKSQQLNQAVQKTLEVVQKTLIDLQPRLLKELKNVPADPGILKFLVLDPPLNQQTKQALLKVINLVDTQLILCGKGGFVWFGIIPDDIDTTACLGDLPHAIHTHSQLNKKFKFHPILEEIETFFKLDFIENSIHREFVQQEIGFYRRSHP